MRRWMVGRCPPNCTLQRCCKCEQQEKGSAVKVEVRCGDEAVCFFPCECLHASVWEGRQVYQSHSDTLLKALCVPTSEREQLSASARLSVCARPTDLPLLICPAALCSLLVLSGGHRQGNAHMLHIQMKIGLETNLHIWGFLEPVSFISIKIKQLPRLAASSHICVSILGEA